MKKMVKEKGVYNNSIKQIGKKLFFGKLTIEELESGIKEHLPEFYKVVSSACIEDVGEIEIPQDSFADDLGYGELTLLGMAIKYAGLKGVDVRVVSNKRIERGN